VCNVSEVNEIHLATEMGIIEWCKKSKHHFGFGSIKIEKVAGIVHLIFKHCTAV
jgi:hypothetical protein